MKKQYNGKNKRLWKSLPAFLLILGILVSTIPAMPASAQATLVATATALEAAVQQGTTEIKLAENFTLDHVPVLLETTASQVSIDGNGKSLETVSGKNLLEIKGNILVSNLSVENAKNSTVLSAKSGNVTLDNVTINGGQTGTAIVGSTGDITLDGVRINEGGNIVSGVQGKLTIQNSLFDSVSGYAVSSCRNVEVRGTTFQNFPSSGSGNAIESGNQLIVDNCLFQDISRSSGHASAIGLSGNGLTTKVTNSTFIRCGKQDWNGYAGGAIGGMGTEQDLTVENCYFKENKSPMYGSAVGMYAFYGKAVLKDSVFEGNVASNSYNTSKADGGAIGVFNTNQVKSLELTVSGSTFLSNEAEDDGGAIFIEAVVKCDGDALMTKANIVNNTFMNNKGRTNVGYDSGGAIQISLSVDAQIVHNTFFANTKKGSGGAVGYHCGVNNGWTQYPTIGIYNNLFVNNTGSSTNYNQVNVYKNKTVVNGNVGYDNGTPSPTGLTPEKVFGKTTPVLVATEKTAGADFNNTKVSVLPIVRETDQNAQTGTYADRAGDSAYVSDGRQTSWDQKGSVREKPPAAGSVEPEKETTYRVIYDANGGQNPPVDSNTYPKNAQAVVKAAGSMTAPENHSFVRWNTKKDGTGTAYNANDSLVVVTDTTLYAQWVVRPQLEKEYHYAYIAGYPDGTVRPERAISRQEVAMIFFKLMTTESRNMYRSNEKFFADVNVDSWANQAISTMANAGAISGYPNGRFYPERNIKRAEFAAMVVRFDPSETETKLEFSDISGHWAEEAISKAAALGWVSGYEDGTFRPEQEITRAEVAVVVNKMTGRKVNKQENMLEDMRVFRDNMNVGAWYYFDIQEAVNSHNYTRNNDGSETWTELGEDPEF